MTIEQSEERPNSVRASESDARPKNEDAVAIGRRLIELRGDKSQRAFAAGLGIAGDTLGRYERGERFPDSEILLKLSRVGADLHWLLVGTRPHRTLVERQEDGDQRREIDARIKAVEQEIVDDLGLIYQVIDEMLERERKYMTPAKKREAAAFVLEYLRTKKQHAPGGDRPREPQEAAADHHREVTGVLARLIKLAA